MKPATTTKPARRRAVTLLALSTAVAAAALAPSTASARNLRADRVAAGTGNHVAAVHADKQLRVAADKKLRSKAAKQLIVAFGSRS